MIEEGPFLSASGHPSMEITPGTPLDSHATPNRNNIQVHHRESLSQTPNLSSETVSYLDLDDSFFERLLNLGSLGGPVLQRQDSIYSTMSNVVSNY